MKRVSTVILWIGVGLLATGAILSSLGPSAIASAPSTTASKARSAASDSVNPDQDLIDEAATVRRRVEEFRERTRAEEGRVDVSRAFYLVGALLALVGLIGRMAGGKRIPDVEPH